MPIRCQGCGEQLEADARFCGACGAPLADAEIGRVVAHRYRLLERIGRGPLGALYRAEQVGIGRRVAIRLLPPDARREPTTVERFRRESALACRLKSPHTVTTFELDHEPDGSLYIAMELSPGTSLAQLMQSEGAIDWRRAMRMLSDLCDALGEAHELGVIHRDLNPDNILVEARASNRDFVRVRDFGLASLLPADAQLSPVGQRIGSVEYSAPEQLGEQPIDARSDLYALGVVGYHLVTGRHPFHEARGFGEMVAAHLRRDPKPASSLVPGLPPEVDELLARCLAKDPKRRYPHATALAASIGVLLTAPLDPGEHGDTIRDRPDVVTGDEDTAFGDAPTRR